WNGVYLKPSEYKERNALLDELTVKAGRKPTDIKRSMMTQIVFGKDEATLKAKQSQDSEPADKLLERNIVVGTPNDVIDQLGKYAEAGVQRIMLMWRDQTDIDGIEAMASTVLPHFHD